MLTKQKQAYADARMRGLNFKDSAIAAGCPEKTAKQAGSRLEKDADVQAAIGRMVASRKKVKTAKALPVVEEVAPMPTQQPRPLPVPDSVYIPAPVDDADPIKFWNNMMNDVEADPKLRLQASIAKANFTMSKPGDAGKKEEKNKAAGKVAGGRFSPAKPPLSIVKP